MRKAWRATYRDQVELIIALRRRKVELEKLLPELWLRFYGEDEPGRREAVARKELDAALQDQWDVEHQLASEEMMLEEMSAAAYAEGAEPGWFRDLDADLRRTEE